jgi:hypothetical protein
MAAWRTIYPPYRMIGSASSALDHEINCLRISLLRSTMTFGTMERPPLRRVVPRSLTSICVYANLLPKDMTFKVQQLDDLTDDQLMRKLAVLTEMAKPLLARLPDVIDVTPVGVDLGIETNTEWGIVNHHRAHWRPCATRGGPSRRWGPNW